jgi:4-oxalocrotonate tautomerase
MPIVTISIMPGRDLETKRDLLKNVTASIVDTLEVPDESVRIIINEIPFEHYGVAGMPIKEYREEKRRQKEERH